MTFMTNQPGIIRALFAIAVAFLASNMTSPCTAQSQTDKPAEAEVKVTDNPKSDIQKMVGDVTAPDQLPSTLKALLMLGVLSLAPAILLMTTCYVRVVVVLSLLRQAFGGQNLPPNQVITALALFITLLVMAPVWNDVKKDAIDPYVDKEIAWDEAWDAGTRPLRRFMSRQISMAENTDNIWLFYKYLPEDQQKTPETFEDIPIQVLLPAFVISELKIAFLMGFQIFLPFLVIDLIVSSVTISMGMFMLPPTMVSLPLKLILFVVVDGWHLVIGMLLESFAPYV